MHFSPQISILDCETNQRISLEQNSYIKSLGVLIDQNLSWKSHIDSVIVKISKTIGIVGNGYPTNKSHWYYNSRFV